jgi:hypothetical protein
MAPSVAYVAYKGLIVQPHYMYDWNTLIIFQWIIPLMFNVMHAIIYLNDQ